MRPIQRVTGAVESSLKLKLTLFIVTILGLTIGIAPWAAIRMQERQLLDASRERLETLEKMLRKTVIKTCMLTGNREAVQQIIEAVTSLKPTGIRGHDDIEAVRIFDTEGVIGYSSRPEERGLRLSAEELSRHYGHVDPIILTDSGGRATHTLARPIFNAPECFSCHAPEQKVLGILQVSVSIEQMEQQLGTLRRSAFVATLITLGVIVVGVWLSLQHLVDQPLQKLVKVMAQASRGDLSVRAKTRNTDELGRLARHFNEMISKLEVAQQEIERYHQEQLLRADRLATIGEMAAAMAHEIRNPLTGISGALSVLGREFPANDPRRDIVRQTHLLIDRLNKSVEDILHYSRPSPPQFHRVNLDDVVERTVALVEGEAKKARVQVAWDTAVASGGDGASPAVYADPQQVLQVLVNVVLNAIQATPPGGRISIRTGGAESDGMQNGARIEVEDTGKGMTAEEAAKAFQPFFSTKAQGTGLGLPIAKQIIEQHGGRISLHSTPGKGTRVQVDLPLHVALVGQET